MNASRPKGPINIAAMRAQATESLGMEPGMELQMENGTIFHIPSPLLLDDDRQDALNALGDKQNAINTAKAILGESKHLEFLAAGGHSNDISLAWALMSEEARNNPKLPR
jgi:hypothetical protein